MVVDALPFFGVLTGQPGMAVTATSVEPQARILRDQIASTYGRPADLRVAEANAAGQVFDPVARSEVASWIATADPRVTAQLLYDDMTTDLRGRIADISAPVTVAFAWNSAFPKEEQARAFYRQQYEKLPQSTLVSIGPAGHFVMLDRPAEMRTAIEVFLKN